MPWLYYPGHLCVRLLLFLFTRLEVKGRQNVPRGSGILISANHLSAMDPPIVGVVLGRPTVFMAKEELFRSRFSAYLISHLGAFPVHRGRVDKEALRRAAEVLAHDKALTMFPEGARRESQGYVPQGFAGAALIAARSNVPVLPVGITGTEKIRGWTWIFRRPKVTVYIGIPFRLPPATRKPRREQLAALTAVIMNHVTELLPEEYRRHYRE